MKTLDIVKDAPRTNYEVFKRWQNHQTSKLISGSLNRKKIEVKDGNQACDSWASMSSCENPDCSFFNHAMAGLAGGDLPEGFIEW